MTSTVGWVEILDAFDARLDAQETALANGGNDFIDPFIPPAIPEPLPPALAERATALVWRCRAIEDTLAAALDKARAQLERLDGEAAAKTPAQPMYFDSRI